MPLLQQHRHDWGMPDQPLTLSAKMGKDEGGEIGPGRGEGAGGVANVAMGKRGWGEGMGLGTERGESRHGKQVPRIVMRIPAWPKTLLRSQQHWLRPSKDWAQSLSSAVSCMHGT